jgi:hypothetical protein
MINVNELQALPDKAIVERLDDLIAGGGNTNVVKDGTTASGGEPSFLVGTDSNNNVFDSITGGKLNSLLVGGLDSTYAGTDDYFVRPMKVDIQGRIQNHDPQLSDTLTQSTNNGNKVYGLESSNNYPLIGDNTLAICQITTQVSLAQKVETMSYNLFQNAISAGYTAMIPATWNVSIVHTNNGTNDIIVTISAIFSYV